MATKSLRRWRFTKSVSEEGECVEREKLIAMLGLKCSRWVFQLERGDETGYLHYQGRCSLKAGRNQKDVASWLGCGFSQVSPEHETESNDFYLVKEETRVDGPWSDKDCKKAPVPWDLKVITEWKPWQMSLFESFKEKDDRIINVLIDEVGGIGKTKVFKKALYEGWIGMVPAIGDAKDIVQAVCSMGPKDAYVVDLPRCGESDQHMRSIYKAIEMVKNGVVLDYRYSFKQLIMGSPVIWVFTNLVPNMDHLSADRWRLWSVADGELRRCAVNELAG